MKKILSLFFVFTVFLSGCNSANHCPYPMISNICFIAEIEYKMGLLEYQVKISDGKYEINLLKNGEPTEFSVTFYKEEINFSYKEINYKSSLSQLPDGLIIDLVYTCFNSLPKNKPTDFKDDIYFINNKTPKYDYSIYFSETGLPYKMEEKNNSVTAIFKNMKLI